MTEISSGTDEYEMEITGDGVYYFTVEVAYEGATYEDTIAVEVLDRLQIDMFFKGKWNEMKTALINNDVDHASLLFSQQVKGGL